MGRPRFQANKPHKSRFSSKSSPHRPRTDASISCKKKGKTQQCKITRGQKRAALLKEKRAGCGSDISPPVILLFPLSESVNMDSAAFDLLTLLADEGPVTADAFPTVASQKLKFRATLLKAPYGDLQSCIVMGKIANLIAFVASAAPPSQYIDLFGLQCLSVFRSLGMPNTAVLIRDLPTEVKQKQQSLKKILASKLTSEFPKDCRFYPANTIDELRKFICVFKDQRTISPHWRTLRPYVMADRIDVEVDGQNPGKCSLVLSGYLRAHNLSVNHLVHLQGAGDFQLSKIEILKDPWNVRARKEHDMMAIDDKSCDLPVSACLIPDPMIQEPLVFENTPDPLTGEQTWPTSEEMAKADMGVKGKQVKKRLLPQGISKYQAAWITDDSDKEISDDGSSENGDSMVLDEDEGFLQTQVSGDDIPGVDCEYQSSLSILQDDETEATSMAKDDEDDTMTRQQLDEEYKLMKAKYAEDMEFPDEVDTPTDVPARKRFAKYRGIKSFKTSIWDPKESLPTEYGRIFAFDNFSKTQKHVLSKVSDQNCIGDFAPVGSYLRLHVADVPCDDASRLCAMAQTVPVILSGLLQHESKMSVLHFSIRKHDSYEAPIKAKEELIFHVGFRQFVAIPLFSSDNINSDKHRMERFLHSGCFSIASVYAPINFHSLPLVALKYSPDKSPMISVAAVGSLRSVNPDRIILKKIILTGYPLRVSKTRASIRYMFHYPEDVRWFKPVELWTKRGQRGLIKEPLGTHGAMKCVFNGVVQQHDTACMSLYKRVYPKWPEHIFHLPYSN